MKLRKKSKAAAQPKKKQKKPSKANSAKTGVTTVPDRSPASRLRNSLQYAGPHPPELRIGSDCSGWCSEVQAANNVVVGATIKHIFATDKERSVRTLVCLALMYYTHGVN